MKNLDVIENCIQYYDIIKSSEFLSDLFNNHYEFIKNNELPIELYSYIYLEVVDDSANLFSGVYIYLGLLENTLYFRSIATLSETQNDFTTTINVKLTVNEFNEYFNNNRSTNNTYIKRYIVPGEIHNENILKLHKSEINNKRLYQIIFTNNDFKDIKTYDD